MERAVKREVLATLIRAGRRDLARVVANNVPVSFWADYLVRKLTQWDMQQRRRAMKRGEWDNPYALGIMLGAVERVKKGIASFAQSTDPADYEKLKKVLMSEVNDFPPRRATLKAIDKYLQTGKRPK